MELPFGNNYQVTSRLSKQQPKPVYYYCNCCHYESVNRRSVCSHWLVSRCQQTSTLSSDSTTTITTKNQANSLLVSSRQASSFHEINTGCNLVALQSVLCCRGSYWSFSPRLHTRKTSKNRHISFHKYHYSQARRVKYRRRRRLLIKKIKTIKSGS